MKFPTGAGAGTLLVVADLDRLAAQARVDPEALGRLVQGVQRDVWRVCAHLTAPGDADDLAQETLLRMVAGIGRWHGDAVKPWVLGIARNVCLEHLRRRRRRRTDPAAEVPQPFVADPAGYVDVMSVLADLPIEQREAVVLTQIIGLQYADAAAIVGCPVGTVRSRVARGRDGLAVTMRMTGRRQRSG